jgi:hypothetical protein
MLAGTSKEDKEAMLAAQKQAASNTENTIKLMSTPAPAASMPSTTFRAPTPTPFTPTPFTPAAFVPQVVMSSTGKPMPVQPPQEEL